MQLFGLRVGDGTAQAAADDRNLFQAFQLAGLAQRADKVVQAVALIEQAERHGSRADLLEDDRDRPLFTVEIRDGERDALAVRVHAQDDELAGLSLAGHVRRIDHHQLGVRVQRLLFQNLIH